MRITKHGLGTKISDCNVLFRDLFRGIQKQTGAFVLHCVGDFFNIIFRKIFIQRISRKIDRGIQKLTGAFVLHCVGDFFNIIFKKIFIQRISRNLDRGIQNQTGAFVLHCVGDFFNIIFRKNIYLENFKKKLPGHSKIYQGIRFTLRRRLF